VGTLLAMAFRRQGPRDPVYNFELEDPNAPLPEWWMNAHPNHPDTLSQREKESNQEREKQKDASNRTEPPSFSSPSTS